MSASTQPLMDRREPDKAQGARDLLDHRMMLILEACSDRISAPTISEIARRTALAKSTVHRLCWRFVQLGILGESEGTFSIGHRINSLASGNMVLKRLRGISTPLLVELQSIAGASQLAVLSGQTAHFVDALFTRAFPTQPLIGVSLPLHCTATGKAMLAHLPPDDAAQIINTMRLTYATKQTILLPAQLQMELQTIRREGFSLSHQEMQTGINALAVAFSYAGNAVGAIGILGPVPVTKLRMAAKAVVEAAEEIGRHMEKTER